jgi:DNA polymerase I-like protein with 3'-5' exonuclease and polymerase domains
MDEDVWSQDTYDRLMSDRPNLLAIDSETTGLKWSDTAFGVSFAWYRENPASEGQYLESGYIDIRHAPVLWGVVRGWLEGTGVYKPPTLIFWNAKFDMHKLGLYPQADKFHDGCLITYILDENYPKKLKVLAEKVLKEETDEAQVLAETRKALGLTVSDGFEKLPLSVVAPYAMRDAEYTLRLYTRLAVALAKEPELEAVYSLERQLLLCVAGTERRGLAVDTDYLQAKIIELGDEIISLEREIATIVGKPVGPGGKLRVPDGKYKNGNPKFRLEDKNEFNPNSPKQVQDFFYSVGVELSGTDEDALGAVSHPLATVLLSLRGVRKLRNTYLVNILGESVDGVFHPNFNLTGTKTGRFSSSGASDG